MSSSFTVFLLCIISYCIISYCIVGKSWISLPVVGYGHKYDKYANTAHQAKQPLHLKLIIYDFDRTITADPLYGTLSYSYSAQSEQEQFAALTKESFDLTSIFGGKERIQRLRDHFSLITNECNITVSILTFGWYKVVVHALRSTDLLGYFDKVIARNTLLLRNHSYHSKELSMIKMESIKNDFNEYRSDNILFIDDNYLNTQTAYSIQSLTMV